MKAIDFINGLNESFSKIEEGSWIPSIKVSKSLWLFKIK